MSPYETPEALRAGLEARLRSVAASGESTSLSRLRRAVVFESIVRRLEYAEPGRWVVKGGMCLEWRHGADARSTVDLDLCVDAPDPHATAMRERLIDALSVDPVGDRFTFDVGEPDPLRADFQRRRGFRFALVRRMGGRRFENVKLDVVPRLDEIVFRETLERPSALGFAGVPPFSIEAAGPAQNFAEKLHAITRDHGDRPNTRVHDLVDLVLLLERDTVDPTDAATAVAHVFRVCATHAVPESLPDPPFFWARRYPVEARGCNVTARTLDDALKKLRQFWSLVTSRVRRDPRDDRGALSQDGDPDVGEFG